jgi:hypothetical protein
MKVNQCLKVLNYLELENSNPLYTKIFSKINKTTLIEISIEEGTLRSGKRTIHASAGSSSVRVILVLDLVLSLRCISLCVQVSHVFFTALVS